MSPRILLTPIHIEGKWVSSSSRREERYYPNDRGTDQRTSFQRDHDRILYTSAFRRLAWVTQVVSAGEGEPFHNRLTHTLEVAQIGRRLAEHLLNQQREEAEELGGLDPDVVEAAALAHDLGHPPFGHTVEKKLDGLIRAAGLDDGFEGNAQTFRIVAKLATRHVDFPGLNLTRATFNAILKYPWLRQADLPERTRKWGAYASEKKEFDWVREDEVKEGRRSAEAELMDFADDIAYAVHDVEDFFRTGLIPLDKLFRDDDEVDRFLDGAFSSLERSKQPVEHEKADCKSAFKELFEAAPITEVYAGTSQHRARLRSMTAGLIGGYVKAIRLQIPTQASDGRVTIEGQAKIELFVLKQLTWHYVINNPALATQQYGQRRIIRELFQIFNDAAVTRRLDIFPRSYRERLELLIQDDRYDVQEERVRIIADLLSGMTEQQVVAIHQRLTGVSLGTVMDSIVR